MATPMNESENGVEMALIKKYCCSLIQKHEGFRTQKERGLCQMQSGGGKLSGGGLSVGSCSRCSMGVYCVCTRLPLFFFTHGRL
jgi:hypothetical protein